MVVPKATGAIGIGRTGASLRRARCGADIRHEGRVAMRRIILGLVVIALLGFAALTGYAYLADLAPDPAPVRLPVTLDAN